MTVTSDPGLLAPGDAPEIIDLRDARDADLLRAFYDQLYLPAFPAPEHREDLDAWERDLWEAPEGAASRRYLLIAGRDLRDPVRRRLWGGHMFEYYPDSDCGLLSYIVVAPDHRRRGLGRTLVTRGLAMLEAAAHDDGGASLRAIFAESIDPRRAPAAERAEAWDRIEILGRLGARILDVPYVAPSLGPGRARARDLLLMHVASDPDSVPPLPRDVLIDYLHEFYAALGVDDPASDPDFAATIQALPDPDKRTDSTDSTDAAVRTVEIRREAPSLRLPALTIAFHFVRARNRGGRTTLPDDETFNSFERDLVSHAYRNTPPFASQALRRPFVADVAFPPEVNVRSEGQTIRLVAGDGDGAESDRRRRLRVLRSRTVFTDGIVIDHLVLTNLGLTDPATVLTEYDVVKLLKLHGGGEASDIARELRLSTADGDLMGVADWLGRLDGFDDGPGLSLGDLRAATVLITTGDDEAWGPLYDLVGRLPTEADQVVGEFRTLLAGVGAEAQGRAQRLKACEGIVCSLLNFGEIDHWELADALEPALGSPEFLLWLQKANLVCLTKFDRITSVEACRRDIGASPYLLAPHAVLLHNEEVLRHTDEALDGVTGAETRRELDEVRRVVVRNLRQDLLPNVFHYRTERMIFDTGDRDRGLRDQTGALERRLTQLDGQIGERVHRAQAREERVLTIVFGLLSATALGDLAVVLLSDAPRWTLVVHGVVFLAAAILVAFLLRAAGRQ